MKSATPKSIRLDPAEFNRTCVCAESDDRVCHVMPALSIFLRNLMDSVDGVPPVRHQMTIDITVHEHKDNVVKRIANYSFYPDEHVTSKTTMSGVLDEFFHDALKYASTQQIAGVHEHHVTEILGRSNELHQSSTNLNKRTYQYSQNEDPEDQVTVVMNLYTAVPHTNAMRLVLYMSHEEDSVKHSKNCCRLVHNPDDGKLNYCQMIVSGKSEIKQFHLGDAIQVSFEVDIENHEFIIRYGTNKRDHLLRMVYHNVITSIIKKDRLKLPDKVNRAKAKKIDKTPNEKTFIPQAKFTMAHDGNDALDPTLKKLAFYAAQLGKQQTEQILSTMMTAHNIMQLQQKPVTAAAQTNTNQPQLKNLHIGMEASR